LELQECLLACLLQRRANYHQNHWSWSMADEVNC
jgi:hypothetical protein